jgi:hypothetical protein
MKLYATRWAKIDVPVSDDLVDAIEVRSYAPNPYRTEYVAKVVPRSGSKVVEWYGCSVHFDPNLFPGTIPLDVHHEPSWWRHGTVIPHEDITVTVF